MKKKINGKSYNTQYDSEFICKYTLVTDSWCRTAVRIFRKKSTGEYFRFDKWSSWNDGWDISLISEKIAQKIIKNVKAGLTFHYTALYSGTRTLKKGYSMWGTEDDNPWDGKKVEERKERMRREKEEMIRKSEEAAKAKELAGEKTWGVMRITGCSDGHKFTKFSGKAIPTEKIGRVKFHKITMRVEDNDKGNGYNCAYTYRDYIILEDGDKQKAKDVMTKVIGDVVAEKGNFDPIMKGGHLIMEEPVKNQQMWKEISSRIKKMNEAVIWG